MIKEIHSQYGDHLKPGMGTFFKDNGIHTEGKIRSIWLCLEPKVKLQLKVVWHGKDNSIQLKMLDI